MEISNYICFFLISFIFLFFLERDYTCRNLLILDIKYFGNLVTSRKKLNSRKKISMQ